MQKNILIVIFTFNEEKNISKVLNNVLKISKNILVVDNNSSDETLNIVKRYSVNFIKHKYNLGKSNSMKTALDFSRINNYDYIAFMDGDNQHGAQDMMNICNKIVEINCDLVIGYRKDLRKLNFSKKIGTLILRNLFYILFRKKILDIQSGLRVFKTNNYKINWESTGLKHYFADAEITCSAIKNKCNIFQLPIETISSEKYKGMNILQGIYLSIMLIVWRFV